MLGSRLLYVLSTMLLVSIAYSGSETQTDWAGGTGVPGPVDSWGINFNTSVNINFSDVPGFILLEMLILDPPSKWIVDDQFGGAWSVFSSDIDGDGDMDVLGAAGGAGDITWWENVDGTGTAWTEHIVDNDFSGAVSVFSADIDGDGDMDVLGAANGADDITCWENIDGTGTTWTKHVVDDYFDGAWSVYSSDIDGDGDMDVLGAAYYADITWWENVNGTGTAWTKHIVDSDFDGTVSVFSADIDGDGDMDVLGAAVDADDISWWENTDGTGTTWTKHIVDVNFDLVWSVYSSDIDGDGDMDVLGAAYLDDITWWENVEGTGTTWTEHIVDSNFDGAVSVFSADVDGDGDMDVLGASFDNPHDISWWENADGSGTSWIEHIVNGYFDGTRSAIASDIDGDGYMDVIGAGYYEDDISWWKVIEICDSGELESSILYIEEDPAWDLIDWTASIPAGTSVSFCVRSSDDYTNMGEWSGIMSTPGSLQGVLTDGDRYVQYKVFLETEYPGTANLNLEDVTITWNPLSIGEESSGAAPVHNLFGPGENPVHGIGFIGFSIPDMNHVSLELFDLTGRKIAVVLDSEVSSGVHQAALPMLQPGLYFTRMVSGEFNSVKRFMVVE